MQPLLQSAWQDSANNVKPAGPNTTPKVLDVTIEASRKLPIIPASEKHFVVDKIWDVDLVALDKPSSAYKEYVDTGLPCRHMAVA
jgi:hypothetical protein